MAIMGYNEDMEDLRAEIEESGGDSRIVQFKLANEASSEISLIDEVIHIMKKILRYFKW